MLTEKQREYCKLYVSANNATDAYSLAFKTANLKTSAAAASRLLKRDEIQRFISEVQAENRRLVDKANEQAANDLAEGSIANSKERMQILTKIMRGKISIKQEAATKDGVVTLLVKPSHSDRRAAIAELNKMDGSYAPAESKISLTDQRDPSKLKLPNGKEIEL